MKAKDEPGNYTEWLCIAMMIAAVVTAIHFFDEYRMQKTSTKECLDANAIQKELTKRFCEHANSLVDITAQQDAIIEELTGEYMTPLTKYDCAKLR